MDAAIFNESSSLGVGCVIWNSSGEFILAKSMPIYQKLGPKEVETVGVREALSWIKPMGLTKVLVEMDSQVVFNALNPTASAFNLLVKDCQEMVNSMDNTVARVIGSMSNIIVF